MIKIQAVDNADNISAERILRFPPSVEIIAPTLESNGEISDTTIRVTGPSGLKIKHIAIS